MDTGTHVVMGIGLGGLAMLDPVVANDSLTAEAVLIGTLAGSLAPDFDTIFKIKNNATYIRHHRGLSHSTFAVLLWSILISGMILLFMSAANGLHLWLWTLFAVFIHVFVDIFNAYGTQLLRPFSDKWVRLGIINIFDPIIFGAHVVGILLWVFNINPGYTFLTIYVFLMFYYFWRANARHKVVERTKRRIPEAEYVNVSPSFRWTQWHVAVRTPSRYYVLEIKKDDVVIFNKFPLRPVPDNKLMSVVKQDKNVHAFLSFSPIYRWETKEYDNYKEIRFVDLRYRAKDGHYPFVAIVHLDENLSILSSFTGWVYSEEKLQKKLEPATTN